MNERVKNFLKRREQRAIQIAKLKSEDASDESQFRNDMLRDPLSYAEFWDGEDEFQANIEQPDYEKRRIFFATGEFTRTVADVDYLLKKNKRVGLMVYRLLVSRELPLPGSRVTVSPHGIIADTTIRLKVVPA